MKRLLTILVLGLVLVACDRTREPLVYEGTPVFYLDGRIGSEDVTVQAGKEGYYMYSAYEQDQRGMYSFTAELKESKGDGHRFKFFLNDNEFSEPSQESKVQESVVPSKMSFVSPPEKVDFLKFTLEPDEWHINPEDQIYYEWTDAEGRLATTREAEFFYRKSLFQPTEICLEMVNESQGIRRTACNVVYYENSCDADFGYDNWSAYFNFFVKNPSPTALYLWVFSSAGSAPAKTGTRVSAEYNDVALDEICLTVNNANECGKIWCQNVIVDSSAAVSLANMNYQMEELMLEAEQKYPLGQFHMEYTDPSGVTYRSSEDFQSSGSRFEILDVSPYDNNEMGQKTLKVTFELTCDLFSESGELIHIDEMRGVMAVAHP